MTPKQFKVKWESGEDGGGINFDTVAECAKAWGLYSNPRINPMDKVLYDVLKKANVNDCEEYNQQQQYECSND